jgi:anti-anti-sigma factor
MSKKKSAAGKADAAATAVHRLPLTGELTIYTAAELKGRLLTALAAADPVEIDLSQVSEIDTAGLQLLMLAKREAAERGTPLTLTGHSHAVIECLDLCNLAAVFGDQVVISAPSA